VYPGKELRDWLILQRFLFAFAFQFFFCISQRLQYPCHSGYNLVVDIIVLVIVAFFDVFYDPCLVGDRGSFFVMT